MKQVAELISQMFTRSEAPAVRMKGKLSSRKLLMLHFKKPGDASLHTFQYADLCNGNFSVSQLLCNGNSSVSPLDNGKFALIRNRYSPKEQKVLATFDTQEQAEEVLNKIAKCVAPSRWRWVRRGLFLCFVYWLFATPSAPKAPPGYNRSSGPIQQMQRAPEISAQTPVPQVPSPVPQVPAAANLDAGDPFGLRLAAPPSK